MDESLPSPEELSSWRLAKIFGICLASGSLRFEHPSESSRVQFVESVRSHARERGVPWDAVLEYLDMATEPGFWRGSITDAEVDEEYEKVMTPVMKVFQVMRR